MYCNCITEKNMLQRKKENIILGFKLVSLGINVYIYVVYNGNQTKQVLLPTVLTYPAEGSDHNKCF